MTHKEFALFRRQGGENRAFANAGDFIQRAHAHPGLETGIISGRFRNHSPDEDAVSVSIRRRG